MRGQQLPFRSCLPAERVWLVATIALPLACNPWSANAFELPKAVLLRALVLLLGLAVVIQAADGARPWLKPATLWRLPLLWPILVLVLALTLGTCFSIDVRLSLWGALDRQFGWLTQACYIALWALVALQIRGRGQADRLWATLVWGSAPVVAYGLAQALGVDPLGWRGDGRSPVLSTLGRSNFLGSYLVLIIPLTATRWLLSRRRWPESALLAAQLICLAFTQARAAWIGLAAASMVLGAAWLAARRLRLSASSQAERPLVIPGRQASAPGCAAGHTATAPPRRPAYRALGLGLLALVVTLVAAAMLHSGRWTPEPAIRTTALRERVSSLVRTDRGSGAARLAIWRTTLRLVADRPWLGYGPDSLRLAFTRVFPPELVYYQGRDVRVDRAHNIWLDLAASAGPSAALAFAALALVLGRMAWYGWQHAAGAWERALWTGLAAAVLGHLVDLQFGFEVVTTGFVFWLVLALATAVGRGVESSQEVELVTAVLAKLDSRAGQQPAEARLAAPGDLPGPAHRPAALRAAVSVQALPLALLVLALLGQACLRPLLADAAFWVSQQATRNRDERLAAGMQAVRLWPLEPEYHLGLGWLLADSDRLPEAEVQIAAAYRLSPEDAGVRKVRGDLYLRWSEEDTARLAQAEAWYRRALDLAPNVSRLHSVLGLALASQGRLSEALPEVERAVALDATDGYAYGLLAGINEAAGRPQEAAAAWQQAARWNSSSP